MNVIVFGAGGYNTLGVVRNLKKEHINCFLLLINSNQNRLTTISNAVQKYKIVDTAKDG